MVNLCSLSELSSVEYAGDVNLFIVRNQKSPIVGLQHFKQLAPSEELYTFFYNNKGNENWWEVFSAAFKEELKQHEKQVGLHIVQDFVRQGLRVNLVCYCGDFMHCHRSLVAEELEHIGLEVNLI